MLFRDVRLKDKQKIMQKSRKYIINKMKKSFFNFDDLSRSAVNEYVELLLLNSDFNVSNKCFIHSLSAHELTLDELASIAYTHITQNISLFIK